MAKPSEWPTDDARALDQALFELSKTWWLVSLWCRVGVFVVGLVVILTGAVPKVSPIVTIVLAIAAQLCVWQSIRTKETAEALLRRLDMRDSFGWQISRAEMSDLLASIPAMLAAKLPVAGGDGEYFSSTKELGPKRALENIQESAWWSKHVAKRTAVCCFSVAGVAIAVSLLLVVVSIQTVRDYDVLCNVGRVVTATIALLLSLSLLPLADDYKSFANSAAQVERDAARALGTSPVSSIEAVKTAYEYQVARALAPLLPTCVHNSMRPRLNNLWAAYRSAPD